MSMLTCSHYDGLQHGVALRYGTREMTEMAACQVARPATLPRLMTTVRMAQEACLMTFTFFLKTKIKFERTQCHHGQFQCHLIY